MKINSIVNRHIFKEMIPPFVINLVFLTFVFLMTKILDITNLIVNYSVTVATVFWILLYSMPHFLEFVIPMSTMMAVLLTFLKMSNDNEIIALRAGGVSLYGLLPPVLLFCLLGGTLTFLMSVYGLPWGRLSFKELSYKVAASNVDIGLKERSFTDSFDGVMLYVNKIDIKTKTLIDVFIEDQREQKVISTVVAPKGKLFSEPGKFVFRLRLYNGTINQVGLESRSVHTINFDTYDISLDLKGAVSKAKNKPKDEKEMSLTELRHYLRNTTTKGVKYYAAQIEFHKKFSISFACFVLGFLALPLGMPFRTTRRSLGLGLGLLFFLLYYLLLSAAWVFGETGVYPPVIGMWLPNVVMGGTGIYLFRRTMKEHPIEMDYIPRLIEQFLSRFKSRCARET